MTKNRVSCLEPIANVGVINGAYFFGPGSVSRKLLISCGTSTSRDPSLDDVYFSMSCGSDALFMRESPRHSFARDTDMEEFGRKTSSGTFEGKCASMSD